MPATRGMVVATIAAAFAALALALAPAPARADQRLADGDVYARVSGTEVVLGNELVERRWSRDRFVTTALIDKRAGRENWARDGRDFSLGLAAAAAERDLRRRPPFRTPEGLNRGGNRA